MYYIKNRSVPAGVLGNVKKNKLSAVYTVSASESLQCGIGIPDNKFKLHIPNFKNNHPFPDRYSVIPPQSHLLTFSISHTSEFPSFCSTPPISDTYLILKHANLTAAPRFHDFTTFFLISIHFVSFRI